MRMDAKLPSHPRGASFTTKQTGTSMAKRTIALASSAIISATYDDQTKQMQITFTDGRTYDFPNVPEDVFDGLAEAPSAGRYYTENIKGVFG